MMFLDPFIVKLLKLIGFQMSQLGREWTSQAPSQPLAPNVPLNGLK